MENNFRSKKVKCIETEKIFINITGAEKALGICHVGRACRKNSSAGGYHWQFI
jgi:hypothetical protein